MAEKGFGAATARDFCTGTILWNVNAMPMPFHMIISPVPGALDALRNAEGVRLRRDGERTGEGEGTRINAAAAPPF